jgi:hypothetical protein
LFVARVEETALGNYLFKFELTVLIPSATSVEGVTKFNVELLHVFCDVTLGPVAALLGPEDEGNTTVRTWGHCIV